VKSARNLSLGIASSIWSALIGLAVVPFYIKYLGVEAYGLIGFFVTLQAIFGLLDMGMAPTINREVARCTASGKMEEAGQLLRVLAIIYWGIAASIAVSTLILAPWIAESWLKSKILTNESLTHAVILMGMVVACRWPVGLYQGVLLGAQRLGTSSTISLMMVTVGNIGAVVIVALVSPTIEAFFIWQACMGIFYVALLRKAAWRIVGDCRQYKFDIERLKSVWRFSVGMSGVAMMGVILIQMDKVLLSRILSLEDFGKYMLAWTVANGLYVILTPTFNVLYPRLSAYVAVSDTKNLVALYRTGTRLLGVVIFPFAIAIALTSNEIITLWTKNPVLATSLASIVPLLVIGTALNGIMHFPYALQLAFGSSRIPLIITVVLAIIFAPLVIVLSSTYGLEGGGIAWLVLNVLYVLFGTWLTHRHFLKGVAVKWLTVDVGMPLLISMIVMLPGKKLIDENNGNLVNVILIFMLALAALLIGAMVALKLQVRTVLAEA
jgi:O-antigen/teichoic acid export membrane protein